jgi:hypothetical protein
MRQFFTLRKISLILCFIFVLFGCAENKDIAKAETGFYVTAEGISEGIRMDFYNIPEDTYSLFIGINLNDQGEELFDSNIYIWDNEFSKNELSKLKQSGYLQCPFVKNGHEYTVTVTVYTWNDFENNFEVNGNFLSYSTDVTAGGGIYLTNNPSLNFTDGNSTVTLSEMPEFSEDVIYSSEGLFQFNNFVIMDDGNSYGGGLSYWNELIYPVRQVLSSTQEHFGFTGDFPVNASVYSCLMDGDHEWSVIVAKAEEEAIMSF